MASGCQTNTGEKPGRAAGTGRGLRLRVSGSTTAQGECRQHHKVIRVIRADVYRDRRGKIVGAHQKAHNERVRLWLALCGIVLLAVPAPAQSPRAAVITGHPGDVIRVDGQVAVLGKTWKDLVGIDLATKPGSYRMSSGVTLRVLPKDFPVRRLTVDPNFVTP